MTQLKSLSIVIILSELQLCKVRHWSLLSGVSRSGPVDHPNTIVRSADSAESRVDQTSLAPSISYVNGTFQSPVISNR